MDGDAGNSGVLVLVSFALIIVPLLIAKRSKSGMLKVRVSTISTSLAAFVGVVWITVVDEAGTETSIEVFGEQPLGLPLFLFMPLLFLVLGAPIPFLIRHFLIRLFLENGALAREELPDGWERGQSMAKWVFGYVVLLVVIWIVYADHRGI